MVRREPGGAMSRIMAVAAAMAVVAALAAANLADAAEKVVLQLHGPAQFEFAGYYAALWKGFYDQAGLSVEIKPGEAKAGAGRGAASADPVREVTEGRAQFGTGGGEVVVRTAQGQPLLLLAPIFQRSGAGIYYRAEDDLASPGALADVKVGRLPASDPLDIELVTALKAEGIDPEKLKSVPLEPGQEVAALVDGRVEAVPGSAWDLPWRAHENGLTAKVINPADYRVEFYGDTLFTLRRFADAKPEVVRAFRAASLKGWEYALTHQDEIADRLLAELPRLAAISDPAGFMKYQAELARALARFPAVALGHSNPDRWNRIQMALLQSGAVLRTADPAEFVYDPDAAARSRTDHRAIALLAGALGLVVLATLWLLLRRRRRPERAVAAPGAAAASPTSTAAAAETAGATASRSGAIAATSPPRPVVPAKTAQTGPAPTDLNAVVTRLERTLRQRVPRRVAFRLSLLPELWQCRVDPQAVRALVLDLVDAAAAELKGKGDLVVGTRNYAFTEANLAATPGAQPGEYVRVTVRDNGSGLSDEALDKVFDAAATTRPSAALAKATMQRLGGFVRIESAESVGTAIHLYFPRASEKATAKPAAAAE
jgi:ABC-type nitrate/sulfonate/bicarbonate transport system substrate-binding protein